MTFGQWLRAKRIEKNVSYRGLADSCNLSKTQIFELERGGIENPGILTCQVLAEALGYRLSSVIRQLENSEK